MSAAPQPSAARRSEGGGEGVLQSLRLLITDLPGLVSDRVHLLALELRRAGLALGEMVALGVGAAVLGLTAWLALWVGVAAAAIHFGMPWGWVWALVLLLNLGGAWLAVTRLLGLVQYLKLPATMRRLTVPPPAPAPEALHADTAAARPPMTAQSEPVPMP